jgi:hypothetical protein
MNEDLREILIRCLYVFLILLGVVTFMWFFIFQLNWIADQRCYSNYTSSSIGNDTCHFGMINACGASLMNCTSGKQYSCVTNVVEVPTNCTFSP